MNRHIFLTGVTGFVGRNLLAHLRNANPTDKFSVLLRAQSQTEGEMRFMQILKSMGDKIDISQTLNCSEVLVGDVTTPRLGLSSEIYQRISRSLTHIIHCAANVCFQLPLSQARLCNVGGTSRIIELAQQAQKYGRLQRLAYLSTAYVCGDRSGMIYEDELYCNQQFDNSYQQSKCESEQMLITQKSYLPITIFRPSIIVGNSKTGRTSAFNVIYYPLKLLYRGILKFIPGSPNTPLDIVPIDYVCDAINHILLKSDVGIGQTFHLTSGLVNSSTTGEIIDRAVKFFVNALPGLNIRLPKFISPKFYQVAKFFAIYHSKEYLRKLESYIPFLNSVKIFDNSNTLAVLSHTAIKVPSFNQYLDKILQYCIDVDWGHKVPSLA
jgi:thioester reductase-like protein